MRAPLTVARLFYEALAFDLPDALAIRASKEGFRTLSHREVQAQVERLALVLRAKGLEPGDRVAILCENRPEWAIIDFACALAGLVSVPIYTSLTPDQCAFILKDSGARWLFLGPSHGPRLAGVLGDLPDLSQLVLLDPKAFKELPRPSLTWEALMEAAATMEDRRPEAMAWAEMRREDELLTLIYTSGTTADPKGAMLTQGNVASDVQMCVEVAGPTLDRRPGDRCLSVLPLCHVFERTAGHYTMWALGVAIYYAESIANLSQTLLDVRPQILMAVPRLYEKLYARIGDTARGRGWVGQAVFTWANDICARVVPYLFRGRQPGFLLRVPWRLADRLLLSTVREKLGGRLRFAISGGAALDSRVLRFFWAMGIPIYEGYGLTETSPVLTLNRAGQVRAGTVGHPLVAEHQGRPFLKLAKDGEILTQGPHVMQGYWRNPEATAEMFTEDGYFKTGDLGAMDKAGRVRITDRKKEILVLSGGKNVAPQPIENRLKEDRFFEQVVLVGHRQNYVAALIVPHFPAVKEWAAHHHVEAKTDAELAADPKVFDMLRHRVEKVNKHLASFEKIRRIALLEKELTLEGGFLTPSLKIKRREVEAAFRDIIDSLFEATRI